MKFILLSVASFLGRAKAPVREATIHQAPNGDFAIRQNPWKLIFLKGGARELYNLQTDLSETTNIAEANTEVVDRLTTLMKKYIADGRSTAGMPQKNDVVMSVDNDASGKKKDGKRGRKRAGKEVALALDSAFD